MDVLDDVLRTLDLRGVLYFRTDFSGPWAVRVPDHPSAARFHFVLRGGVVVTVAGHPPLTLDAGDIVLVPRGAPHMLADRVGNHAPPLEQVLAACGYTGDGVVTCGAGDTAASTRLVCGHFTFRSGADHPLLRALPDFVHAPAATRGDQVLLGATLDLLRRRVFEPDFASNAALARLAEIVFVELLRGGIPGGGDLERVLRAFADRRIGAALRLIHSDPARPWRVESLAAVAGMSRSRFAERFRLLLGTGPMHYVSEWRLQRALAMLEGSAEPVRQVAFRAGFQSAAAFTRAFSERFGRAPRDVRRAIA